ncbi:MAG: hypothetical protein IT294_02885 [Deltaproteobacteria bacterium]|nr:hypothetical protein [Deltaproteobacteria bacterium]
MATSTTCSTSSRIRNEHRPRTSLARRREAPSLIRAPKGRARLRRQSASRLRTMRAITRRLREAGQLLGISLLDHVVIGDERYISFADASHPSGVAPFLTRTSRRRNCDRATVLAAQAKSRDLLGWIRRRTPH